MKQVLKCCLNKNRVSQVGNWRNEIWQGEDFHQIRGKCGVAKIETCILLNSDHHKGLGLLIDLGQAASQVRGKLGIIFVLISITTTESLLMRVLGEISGPRVLNSSSKQRVFV